jgi:hypothetical protein
MRPDPPLKFILISSRFPASQVSGPIKLEKGRVYFMQAFVKEGGGGDHIAVGVKLPNRKTERPIQNSNLFVGPNGKFVASIGSPVYNINYVPGVPKKLALFDLM